MRKGEFATLVVIAVISAAMIGVRLWQQFGSMEPERGIPFYSTASDQLISHGSKLVRQYDCRSCHSLWATRDITQNVPAPALDGIGSLRDEQWLYRYLSAEDPQDILPSRLKKQYQMPSFAHLSEQERHTLASYLVSLKVKDGAALPLYQGHCGPNGSKMG